jgi:catechol 2,3-dioxygenase-like lactoylglutathione lyase family enzyme
MTLPAHAPIRLARPTGDLDAAERFWTDGVGLEVLWRTDAHPADDTTAAGHALLMVGPKGGGWHLEIVADAESAAASVPTEEDLLVIYLGEEPDADWLARIEAAGGRRTPARNPYWDTWGVTFVDPDGYRLVLSLRTWDPS